MDIKMQEAKDSLNTYTISPLQTSLEASPTDSTLWDYYDEFCLKTVPVSWSTIDQKRLISMDFLAKKVFEIHRVDHTYRHSNPLKYPELVLGNFLANDSEIVLDILHIAHHG